MQPDYMVKYMNHVDLQGGFDPQEIYFIDIHKPGWWLGHPSEKYESVNWDDDSNPKYGKIKKATKPPTTQHMHTAQKKCRHIMYLCNMYGK